ncbi:MAG: ISL3 family transposase [Mariniphaga sp.]|nr:ISL3 family transposase [Mariniphaga sp.]
MKGLFALQGLRFGSPQLIDGNISIPACSNQKFAHCPGCTSKSKRVHSSYVRRLKDLPASSCTVSIHFTARKFFCSNPACEKKIFTEQPDPEISPYSRMTNRTQVILRDLFLEVSAKKGAHLARIFSMPVSPSTGLRLISSLPISIDKPVRVLGVDDWAIRKGISYGTILVNIETGQVIDLFTQRDGVSLKKWLTSHPEVKIVTRDRASAYSCAVTAALPDAIQVADRFHLLKNFCLKASRVTWAMKAPVNTRLPLFIILVNLSFFST